MRAVTGDGSVLDSSTDGFTVDSTPPEASLSLLGATRETDLTDLPVVYKQTTGLELQPSLVDQESGISKAWMSVGSYKGSFFLYSSR